MHTNYHIVLTKMYTFIFTVINLIMTKISSVVKHLPSTYQVSFLLPIIQNSLLRFFIAAIKHHDQKKVGEERVYLVYTFILLFICQRKSRQKLKQGRNFETRTDRYRSPVVKNCLEKKCLFTVTGIILLLAVTCPSTNE